MWESSAKRERNEETCIHEVTQRETLGKGAGFKNKPSSEEFLLDTLYNLGTAKAQTVSPQLRLYSPLL